MHLSRLSKPNHRSLECQAKESRCQLQGSIGSLKSVSCQAYPFIQLVGVYALHQAPYQALGAGGNQVGSLTVHSPQSGRR